MMRPFHQTLTRLQKETFKKLGDMLPEKVAGLTRNNRKDASEAVTKNGNADYNTCTIRKIESNDRDDVLAFLRKFFFRQEPMNLAIRLLETENSRCIPMEEYSLSTIHQGYSVMAVGDKGNLMSVIINGLVEPGERDLDASSKVEECADPKFREILRVLAELEERALPHLEGHRVMEVRIAATHSDARGLGFLNILHQMTEKLAIEAGATLMRTDATSAFSAYTAERSGYDCVARVVFKERKVGDWVPIDPAPPHTEAKVYIKRINCL